MTKTFSALAIALSLAGCSSMTRVETPQTAAPSPVAFESADDGFGQSSPPAKWWQLYQDDTLNQLVEQAIEANRDLRVAQANLKRARALFDETDSRRLPSTSVDASLAYGDSIPVTGMPTGTRQWTDIGSFSVNWEADLFGRVSHALEAADADIARQQALRDGVALQVAADTVEAYLRACTLAESKRVAENSREVTRSQLELTEQIQQAGAATRADIESARAALMTAEADIPALEAERQAQLFRLAALLGSTRNQLPQAALECSSAPVLADVTPVGDVANMLRRRPDLREAEQQLRSDTALNSLAIAELYPSISVGGSINYFDSRQTTGDNWSFSVGPLISWQFPNQLAGRARVRQAEAQVESSVAAFEGRIIQALQEVETALTRVTSLDRQVDALEQAAEHAELAYKLTNLSKIAGARSYRDVLETQRDWLLARQAFLNARQQQVTQRVTLFKALGGGWEDLPLAAIQDNSASPTQQP